jgi:hypothetical protein
MGMGEPHESIGGTLNYYGGASCCFWATLSGLALECPLNYFKTPLPPSHVINSVLSKFALSFLL